VKVHWIRTPSRWTHGHYVTGHANGTTDKRKITCRHCRWQAGLNPGMYRGRRTAGPKIEPLGACARAQVLAMVLGLA